jgi:hypothetical protein
MTDMTEAELASRLLLEAKCWAWKRDLLHHRICELSDACFNAFTRDGLYYGAPDEVIEIIERAKRCHYLEELDYCEDACEAAEAAIVRLRLAGRGKGCVAPASRRPQ